MSNLKLAVAALTLVVVSGFATPAVAQGDQTSQQKVSLDLNQADVRQALKLLFDQIGANYSIDPLVQGTVTVHLKDIAFDKALQTVTNQVKASYRFSSGVYEIFPREETTNAQPTDQGTPPDSTGDQTTTDQTARIPVYHADPYVIIQLLAGGWPMSPEMSTYPQGGMGGGMGGGGYGGGMGGGYGGGYGGMGGGMGGYGGGMGGMGGGMGGFGGGMGGYGGGMGGYGGGRGGFGGGSGGYGGGGFGGGYGGSGGYGGGGFGFGR